MELAKLSSGFLGAPLARPTSRLEAEVIDVAVIGWRCEARLLVLHATPSGCRIISYGKRGEKSILARFDGGHVIATEDTGERLAFWIDGGEPVFSMAKGAAAWQPYRA